MSRTTEYAIDLANLEVDLISFIEQLLVREGYIVQHRQSHPGPGFVRSRPDLIVRKPAATETVVVEVKLYRTPRIERGVLQNAIVNLKAYLRELNADRAILVLTAPLSPRQLDRIDFDQAVEIWDLNKLSSLVEEDDELTAFLANFVRSAEIGVFDARTSPEEVSAIAEGVPARDKPGRGAELAAALEACPAGRKGAKEFEKLCEDALKYLFGREFGGWNRQKTVEAGFHRLDLVARLMPRHPFWLALAQDFRTRYVVFEFKNYRDAIGQEQIYTTEKYLFTTALRSVAIIVARSGDNDSARRAIRGALREAGKLILCLHLEEICTLLRGRDVGEDPTNLMIEKLDTILTEIAR